jgi:phosphoglycolate phosphatase-like HAD superfamily hydrolase
MVQEPVEEQGTHEAMTAVLPPTRAVLLDIDGTLVDSTLAHARAWHEALTESGRDVELETLRRCIGMGSDQMLPKVADVEKECDEGRHLCDRCAAFFLERHLPGIRPFPKVRELVELMQERGLLLVVASSAAPDKADRLLEIAGVRDVIDDAATSADADRSKPHPDILFAALAKRDIPAEEAIMLGDTPYDIEAAKRAGVRAVAFRTSGWTDEELAGAIAIYDDPADLLARFDESPFAVCAVGG